MGVECTIYREAISARLDGETLPLPEYQLESHLAQCVACRAWQRDAAELTRALRVRSVESIPDLTRSVLRPRRHCGAPGSGHGSCSAVSAWPRSPSAPPRPREWASTTHIWARPWQATCSTKAPPGPCSGPWIPLGAAWRMNAASGLLPVLSGFLAVLTGFSINDLANGAVSVYSTRNTQPAGTRADRTCDRAARPHPPAPPPRQSPSRPTHQPAPHNGQS